jgi:hypothetical protein
VNFVARRRGKITVARAAVTAIAPSATPAASPAPRFVAIAAGVRLATLRARLSEALLRRHAARRKLAGVGLGEAR